MLEVGEIFQENDEEHHVIFGFNTEGVWESYRVWDRGCWFMFGHMVTLSNCYRRPISKRKIG